MADPNYTPAKPGDFFCPLGGTWYVTNLTAGPDMIRTLATRAS